MCLRAHESAAEAACWAGTYLVAVEAEGATVPLVDDLSASGQTVQRAAMALRYAGAQCVSAVRHGLFIKAEANVLLTESITEVAVSDSKAPFRVPPASSD